MQLPVRFTAGWGATAESCGASASHPRPAHPRPVQLGAVGGAAAGRWPPSAALHVSAGHALAGASCERHTWFDRWIAAWCRPAACAQPPRSVSRVRRPAGLPPAPHQPQRRGRPEPASAAEDEDDAYLLAKSYFDMKARPAPAPPQPALRAPCDAAPPRRSAPLLPSLCTPAQRQGVSRERRPWGPAERGGAARRSTGARRTRCGARPGRARCSCAATRATWPASGVARRSAWRRRGRSARPTPPTPCARPAGRHAAPRACLRRAPPPLPGRPHLERACRCGRRPMRPRCEHVTLFFHPPTCAIDRTLFPCHKLARAAGPHGGTRPAVPGVASGRSACAHCQGARSAGLQPGAPHARPGLAACCCMMLLGRLPRTG